MADIKAEIMELYSAHDPSKLGHIDELLQEWEGEEHVLLAQIRDKFAAEQETKPEETLPSSLPGVDSGVVDDRVAELMARLNRVDADLVLKEPEPEPEPEQATTTPEPKAAAAAGGPAAKAASPFAAQVAAQRLRDRRRKLAENPAGQAAAAFRRAQKAHEDGVPLYSTNARGLGTVKASARLLALSRRQKEAKAQGLEEEVAVEMAPLRPGWEEAKSRSSGKPYYFNMEKFESTWERPTDWGRLVPLAGAPPLGEITSEPVWIGRGEQCGPMQIPSRRVSTLHAALCGEERGTAIIDRSTFGTCVNGERLEKGALRYLRNGDTVEFAGAAAYAFKIGGRPPPAARGLNAVRAAIRMRAMMPGTPAPPPGTQEEEEAAESPQPKGYWGKLKKLTAVKVKKSASSDSNSSEDNTPPAPKTMEWEEEQHGVGTKVMRKVDGRRGAVTKERDSSGLIQIAFDDDDSGVSTYIDPEGVWAVEEPEPEPEPEPTALQVVPEPAKLPSLTKLLAKGGGGKESGGSKSLWQMARRSVTKDTPEPSSSGKRNQTMP